jgi:ATP-dependent DNA helicase
MGTLSMSDASPAKNWDASPVKFEANGGDARDASPIKFEANGGDTLPVLKEEERLLEPVDEPADGILDSLPIDLEAKNGDASLITEAIKKEEEQLEDTRLKAEEEEEARKREEAARLAFDPETRYNKLDELLSQTQLYSEFLLENMDRIAEV